MLFTRDSDGDKLGLIGSLLLLLFFCGCSVFQYGLVADDQKAIHTLEVQGYSDIVIVSKSPAIFGCGEGDAVRFDVEATNPKGERVSLIVCSGILKGSTIRVPQRPPAEFQKPAFGLS